MKMNLQIIKKSKYSFAFSIVMMLLSLGLVFTKGFNLGIDFKGGDLLQLKMENQIDKDQLNSALDSLSVEIPQLKNRKVQYSEGNVLIIRTQEMDENQKEKTLSTIKEKAGSYEIQKSDRVGAVVGQELTRNAIMALILGSLVIIVYISFRFEFVFAIAGLLALLHDIIITLGFTSLLNLEIDTTYIAAILTLLGYSMNDTIVIFDRIRENLELDKKKSFREIIDMSTDQVVTRSLFTSITTLLAVVPLLLFGGETLKTFNAALTIGIVFGTYSSIFLASPLVYLFRKNRKNDKPGTPKKKDKSDNFGDSKYMKNKGAYQGNHSEDEKVLL